MKQQLDPLFTRGNVDSTLRPGANDRPVRPSRHWSEANASRVRFSGPDSET